MNTNKKIILILSIFLFSVFIPIFGAADFTCTSNYKCEGNRKWSCADNYGWTDLGNCPSGTACQVNAGDNGISCVGTTYCEDGYSVGSTKPCTKENGMAGVEICVGSLGGTPYWSGCTAVPTVCGNGKCEVGEDYTSCPQDCKKSETQANPISGYVLIFSGIVLAGCVIAVSIHLKGKRK